MSPDGLHQIFHFCLVVRDLWTTPSIAGQTSLHKSLFPQKKEVPNRKKTSSSIKPNKFHSKYVYFASQKTRKEQKICLKIRLFGFPQRLVMGSTTTAARKVDSSSTLIGPFKIWARAQTQKPLVLALKFNPVLWVASHMTKTSLVVKEMRGHAW